MSNKVICIAGKNSIAINILDFVIENYSNYKIIACINKTDNLLNNWQKSFGKHCLDKKIEIVKIEDLYDISNLYMLSLEFDCLIDTEKFKTRNLFNIHFSLLPAYKGMYTSALPILHDVVHTGVTLHLIDNGIDTGDIIAQEKIVIKKSDDCRNLYLNYLKVGERLVKSNIEKLLYNNFVAIKQSSIDSSYYSKKTIDYKNLILDFNKTANEIVNQVRAFSFREYQLPNAFGFIVYKALILQSRSFSKPGIILDENSETLIVSSIDYDVCLFKDKQDELFQASQNGDFNKIKSIYKTGFDISLKDSNGWDILIVASYHGNLEIVKWIIELDLIKINTTNYKGTTAVMYAMTYASTSKDKSVMEYLIKNGADLTLLDQEGFDIFHYAKIYNNDIYFDLLNYKL